LENSGQLSDGVRGLKKMVNDLNLKVDGILVNDQKTFSTALFDRLFFRSNELKTMEDEKKWILELSVSDQGAARYVGEVLRAWSRNNKVAGGFV
jgi:hypothetical protein